MQTTPYDDIAEWYAGFRRSDNPAGVRGQVGAHHRMLSTYLNSLIATGLRLEQTVEPLETGERGDRHPGNWEVPWLFLGRCRKPQRLTATHL